MPGGITGHCTGLSIRVQTEALYMLFGSVMQNACLADSQVLAAYALLATRALPTKASCTMTRY
jgi:hypothetical protein